MSKIDFFSSLFFLFQQNAMPWAYHSCLLYILNRWKSYGDWRSVQTSDILCVALCLTSQNSAFKLSQIYSPFIWLKHLQFERHEIARSLLHETKESKGFFLNQNQKPQRLTGFTMKYLSYSFLETSWMKRV